MSTTDRPYDDSELPEWARLHIPANHLTVEPLVRRRSLSFSRTATDVPPTPTDLPVPTDDSESTGTRISKRAVLTLAAGVVIALASAMAGVALAAPDDRPSVAIPDPVTTDQGSVMAVSDFCPDRTDGDALTTSGPGSRSSAAGVIAAFDYAYYAQRDGQKVADLMVNPPSTVPVIQAAINSVEAGTRACVTTRPTADPMVFFVDVALQTPTGPNGALRQRITVAQTGSTFKIARVEDR